MHALETNGHATSTESADLRDFTTWADHILTSVLVMLTPLEAKMTPATYLQWEAAHHVLMSYCELEPAENVHGRRFAYVLALEALAASPELVSAALTELARRLRASDPLLAMLKEPA